MAKIKKSRRIKEQESKNNLRTWVRSFNIPRAARATRPARFAARRARKYLAVFAAVVFSGVTLAGTIWPKSQIQLLKQRLVRNPNDFEAHLELTEKFLANNQLEEAERTLQLAQKAKTESNQVLGEKTSQKLEELWQQKQSSDPEDIKKLIAAWEKIVAEKPNYRDGWLQLAILHYKIYENNKAKESLSKALEIDPNYEPAKELEKLLGD